MDEIQIIGELKRQGIDLVSSIPCDRARGLFFLLPDHFRHIGLTREEDGVGISAGAYLAGARPALAIQSSGIGNMLNAILSLTVTFGLPLPILASWRGCEGEKIPAQIPFNRPLPSILSAAGIACTEVSGPGAAHEIGEAVAAAYRDRAPHVILLRPECFAEAGGSIPAAAGSPRPFSLNYSRNWRSPVMTRYDAIRAIAGCVKDEILVSNIGVPSKELYAAGDRPENFYMLGSYTQTSAIGLGIASARPDKKVIVIDGDGSLLGSAILPVIAATGPGNLTIVCLDNGVFGSTGNQPRPGQDSADLALMALGAGFEHASTVHEAQELEAALAAGKSDGPAFIHARIRPGNSDVPNIPLTPAQIRDRFMAALS
ncbi:sulfopyruvate decarboxylase subunit beta [Methanoregula sp.]|uniref:sulfopyruvate decarboxylase subunit beta n=1 Tax=Methanoregula sp. TaxID=2052170 RepID=UPI002BE69175|nr:sulfopyruvate decarboxylase subunit beta [Methanoregula sp.]HVP97124.1 sulfopyruvate decarboxylase subunit beta [Methanoregula sp.]